MVLNDAEGRRGRRRALADTAAVAHGAGLSANGPDDRTARALRKLLLSAVYMMSKACPPRREGGPSPHVPERGGLMSVAPPTW